MKEFYFIARERFCDEESVYSTTVKVEKDDYVVIEDESGKPVVARIVKMLSEFEAITNYHHINEIIQVIDMTAFNKKKEAFVQQRILSKKLDEKLKDLKSLETLEKYAGKDEEMANLLAQFKKLNNPLKEDESNTEKVEES